MWTTRVNRDITSYRCMPGGMILYINEVVMQWNSMLTLQLFFYVLLYELDHST